jgi:hypothetical protein
MKPVYISAEEAVKEVKNGDWMFLHGSAATPVTPVNSLFSWVKHA